MKIAREIALRQLALIAFLSKDVMVSPFLSLYRLFS